MIPFKKAKLSENIKLLKLNTNTEFKNIIERKDFQLAISVLMRTLMHYVTSNIIASG